MKIFKAKTHDAYCLKVLSELLQNNIRTACFEIDEKGIRLCMLDTQRPHRFLINLNLSSENFMLYRFKHHGKLHIGINLNHFHKMLKSIKKKDSIVLYIDDTNMTDLGIDIIPKENNRRTTSSIKIQNIQNLDVDFPTNYGKMVSVTSNEFQKMCKEMNGIGNTIKVVASGFKLRFECDAANVYSKYVEFGEPDDDDDEEELSYLSEFETEQFSRITKIAGLSSNMQIYPKQGLPLLFRSHVGSLGRIDIYIKSKSELENERQELGSEGDDE